MQKWLMLLKISLEVKFYNEDTKIAGYKSCLVILHLLLFSIIIVTAYQILKWLCHGSKYPVSLRNYIDCKLEMKQKNKIEEIEMDTVSHQHRTISSDISSRNYHWEEKISNYNLELDQIFMKTLLKVYSYKEFYFFYKNI